MAARAVPAVPLCCALGPVAVPVGPALAGPAGKSACWFLRQRRRYKAHDERNQCRVGDRVRIIETRPLSAHKRWTVQAILLRPESSGAPEVAV